MRNNEEQRVTGIKFRTSCAIGAALLAIATTAGPWPLSLGAGLLTLIALLWTLAGQGNARQDWINTERKLQESAGTADAIIAAIPSGLVGLDANGAVCRWNQGATRILGMGRGGMVGQHVDRWPIPGQLGLADLLKDALAGNTVNRGSLDVTRTDGKVIPLGISTSRLAGSGGQATGAVAVFQDLTEARKLRERMDRQERLAAIGTLAASIAHEIRNPLASIAGSVEMLAAELDLTGEHKILLDLIIKESDRLNDLITDFLDFSREQSPDPVELSPANLIGEVLRMIRQRPEAGEELQMLLSTEGAPETIVADPAMLKQLCLNLLLNACDAVEWAGTLNITLAGTEHEGRPSLEISFEDDGCGIDGEARKQVFEPFFTTKPGGTGLGLAIAHRIAVLHDGQLELLERDEPGTRFLLRIPTHATGEGRQLPATPNTKETVVQ
jgi:PAS domain S-box-containing protein